MSTAAERPAFLAFVRDSADQQVLQEFAAAQGIGGKCVHVGDISTAATHLKTHPSPKVLVAEIPSAEAAPALLDALAEVCEPDTKVIITGAVNEYSFFCWLTDIGVAHYLLKPLTLHAVEHAYEVIFHSHDGGRKPGKLISVLGTRGGVGATTIAINLAGMFAEYSKKKIALVDLDPQEGTVSLALDIEPSRGFRDGLERPDRIDSLFIERTMSKPMKNLSVLGAEEALHERVNVSDQAAEALLRELRGQFDVVVLDVPRALTLFTRQCLKASDQVVLVSELTMLSLRDAMRFYDLMRESLKMPEPVVVANRVGFASKFEVSKADFEKTLKAKISYTLPYAPEIFMPISTEIAALKHRSHAAISTLREVASLTLPEIRGKKASGKKSGGFSFFSKGD